MGKRDLIESLQAQIDNIVSSGGEFRKTNDASKHRESSRLAESDTGAPQGVSLSGRESSAHGMRELASSPQSDASAAFKKISALVNVRDRSSSEMRKRLAREGFSEDAIEDAVSRAISCGFIDDMRFGDVLVRSRVSQGKGSAGILRELSEHDIFAEDLPGWPYAYGISEEEEIDRALEILKKNPPRAKNKRDAAYRKLMGKGYASSVASSAARIWLDCES